MRRPFFSGAALGLALVAAGCAMPGTYVSGGVGVAGGRGYISGGVGGYGARYGYPRDYGYGRYGPYGYGQDRYYGGAVLYGYDPYGRALYRLPDGRLVRGQTGYAPYARYPTYPAYPYPIYRSHPGYYGYPAYPGGLRAPIRRLPRGYAQPQPLPGTGVSPPPSAATHAVQASPVEAPTTIEHAPATYRGEAGRRVESRHGEQTTNDEP